MVEQLDGLVLTIDADLTNMRRDLASATKLGRDFGAALTRAFEGAALRGRKLGDVLRSLVRDLASSALRAAMKPLQNLFGQAFGAMFGGGLTGGGAGAMQFSGGVKAFARGGVISSPVLFPMGQRQGGLMGEDGPEAIMPLTRGPDGRLGIRASTGNDRPGMIINFHVQATDAASFRRSESQIAAMLARATSQGGRNL